MKTLLLSLPLILGACASPRALPTAGPLRNSVERVLARHDAYVQADPSLSPVSRSTYLADSAWVEAMMALPEVDGPLLFEALEPVMVRHDVYVSTDLSLSPLERDIYLESTARLRSLLALTQPALPVQ